VFQNGLQRRRAIIQNGDESIKIAKKQNDLILDSLIPLSFGENTTIYGSIFLQSIGGACETLREAERFGTCRLFFIHVVGTRALNKFREYSFALRRARFQELLNMSRATLRMARFFRKFAKTRTERGKKISVRWNDKNDERIFRRFLKKFQKSILRFMEKPLDGNDDRFPGFCSRRAKGDVGKRARIVNRKKSVPKRRDICALRVTKYVLDGAKGLFYSRFRIPDEKIRRMGHENKNTASILQWAKSVIVDGTLIRVYNVIRSAP